MPAWAYRPFLGARLPYLLVKWWNADCSFTEGILGRWHCVHHTGGWGSTNNDIWPERLVKYFWGSSSCVTQTAHYGEFLPCFYYFHLLAEEQSGHNYLAQWFSSQHKVNCWGKHTWKWKMVSFGHRQRKPNTCPEKVNTECKNRPVLLLSGHSLEMFRDDQQSKPEYVLQWLLKLVGFSMM